MYYNLSYHTSIIMRYLITGGAGFIGSSLIRNLLEKEDVAVLNVDKLTYAGNLESLSKVENNPNYSFKNIDICNIDDLKAVFDEYKPDKVMHLAAESHVDRSIDDPSEFIKTNILGTYNMLEASLGLWNNIYSSNNQEFIFHHISTDEVYGDLEEDCYFTESTKYQPSSPYSASKASSDHLVRAWQRTYSLPTVITNCSNNYGPYHFPEKLIPHIIISALQGKDLPIYGDGLQERDWLYVDDHVKALINVVSNGVIGGTYNIGGNNVRTNLEVVEKICDILEDLCPNKPLDVKKYKDLIKFVEDRPGHDKRYAIDSSYINSSLDWSPNETFESGLYKTIKWYLENEIWWKRIINGKYLLKRKGKL